MVDLGGILGATVERASARLGTPAVDREVGDERWLVFETPAGSLRARARGDEGDEPATIRSWTLSLREPLAGIEAAEAVLGLELQPALEGDRSGVDGSARRGLRSGGALASLTGTGSPDALRSLTAFDEPPDWREEPA